MSVASIWKTDDSPRQVTRSPGRRCISHRRVTSLAICALLAVSATLAGCQMTQSPFARMATNAGTALAAASTTMTFYHEGKLLNAYAVSSFAGYQSELGGLDQQITASGSGISATEARHLLAIYRQALAVVNDPCLQSSCDWRAQRTVLDQASSAFLRAARP
jgi:hypothetical protein